VTTRYAAFLRAINVRGHAIIRMTDLCAAFDAAGCRNVRSFIQSGNIVFEAAASDHEALFKRVRRTVRDLTGGEPGIVYRRISALEALARTKPFDGLEGDRSLKLYAVFLAAKPRVTPAFPVIDSKERLEAIGMNGLDVLLVSRRKPSGMYGFPNNFIEKVLGVAATSRNWSTVTKLLERVHRP
jgi:uncharacterized protein (DUF1697 family)